MAERVLIVDDDPNVLRALERVLRRQRYEILKADSGEKALALLEGNEVATIICDYNMPEMTGAEVLEHVVANSPDTGRIILTGVQELHTIMDAVNKGQVSHFILKPWEEVTLVQTVRTTVDKYTLSRRNKVLERKNTEQLQQLAEAHKTLKRELAVGASIYDKLLVGETPKKTPGFMIEAIAIPSKEIDGDFRTVYQPAPDCLDVVTGDVMGKGLPAALVATAVKMNLMKAAGGIAGAKVFNSSLSWESDCPSIAATMRSVQEELFGSLLEIGFFATLFFGRFDLRRRRLAYIDCGSPRPLHYSASEKVISSLEGENMPLGVSENESFNESYCHFEPGDFFLFYSDGVTETRNEAGELYGVERLQQIIKTNAQLPPKALLHIIQNSVLAHSAEDSFDDDVTLVLVKLDPKYSPVERDETTAVFARDLSQLELVKDFVGSLCKSIPGDEETFACQMQLAVHEAFANVVKHGGEDKENREVRLRGVRLDEGIAIELADRGVPFAPEDVPHPDLAGNRDSGFGLFIIQEVADEVSYMPRDEGDGWNSLRIYKEYLKEETMNFSHQRENQILVINLEGESLDAKEAPQFKEKVTQLVSEERVDNLVFNLRDLHFIDSSGLGSFLSVLRHVNNRGGDLKLACMTKPIRTMFEVVRMHKLFEIFNNTEDAVRSFSK